MQMDDDTPPVPPEPPEPKPPEPEQPPYVIEGARSSRSKCKSCRKKIDKGVLRLGVLIEGPYGIGYLWHHLTCAAKRRLDDVEAAYEHEAWKEAKEPPEKWPSIEELRKLNEEAEQKRQSRKLPPYIELDPSGRAKCKHCGDLLEKGSIRVVLGREVEFGQQFRTMPIQVHIRCVVDEMEKVDCNTRASGFEQSVRSQAEGFTEQQVNEVLEQIGELPEDADDEDDDPPF